MTDRQLWLALQRKAAELEPALARETLAAFDNLRQALPPGELERLIRVGQFDRFLGDHLSDEAIREIFARLRAEMQNTLRESMLYHWRAAPTALRSSIAFDILNPAVIDAARELNGRVFTRLGPEIRETFRTTIVEGLEAGLNPRTVAKQATDAVGLAPRNAAAVRAFRAELEAGDRAALRRRLEKGVFRAEDGQTLERRGHAGGQGLTSHQVDTLRRNLGRDPLTPDQIDAMVRAYERRLRAWEAESSARTATLDALRTGQRLTWEQAIADGNVDRALLMKRRIVVEDGREREEHALLRGQSVHFDTPYANGEMVSGDSSWNCRCRDAYFVARSVEDVQRITAETMPDIPLAA